MDWSLFRTSEAWFRSWTLTSVMISSSISYTGNQGVAYTAKFHCHSQFHHKFNIQFWCHEGCINNGLRQQACVNGISLRYFWDHSEFTVRCIWPAVVLLRTWIWTALWGVCTPIDLYGNTKPAKVNKSPLTRALTITFNYITFIGNTNNKIMNV